MDRNIGAPNRRIPPDVQPKGSTARDLERREDDESKQPPESQNPEAASTDRD